MRRVAIVGGVRTPFVRAGGVFGELSALDLGKTVVTELVKRLAIDPARVQELIFGAVLLHPRFPNLAREIVLRTDLPKSITAHFISNNCISGLVGVNMIAEAIRAGRIDVGIAGGVESMSRPALMFSERAEKFFLKLFRARSLGERLSILAAFRPGMLSPRPPSPKEPSTGLTMGEHCEITAKEFKIAREAQDQWALQSHQRAARAQGEGCFSRDIVAVSGIEKDGIIRGDSSIEKLRKLQPVFDRSAAGTLTAGNSSSLTDGASAVCLMAEEVARKEGREILGFLEATQYASIAPGDGLLMAPGVALPRLLAAIGKSAAQVDRFEIHEAFAAQVLSNLQVWENGWSKFPDVRALGAIPREKINVWGGSVAMGHPFAATGGRLVMNVLRQLQAEKLSRGVISVCAAGAMACAMSLTRE